MSSIAHSPAASGSSALVRLTTAARQSKVRSPFFIIRSTSTSSAARNVRTAPRPPRAPSRDPGAPDAGLEQVRERASGGHHDLEDVEPGGQRLVERGVHLRGVGLLASPISRYSASLAAPVGDAPAYEIRGCGLKPEE